MPLPEDGAVHIAVRRLDQVDLSAAESLGAAVLERAREMRRPEDRQRFLAGRLAARALVAGMLQVPEDAVTATAYCPECRRGNNGSHGEPRYFAGGEPVPLRISFSRSGGWMAAAAARTRIGVDLEDASAGAFSGPGLEDVMAGEAEKVALAAVAAPDRPRLRAQLWVRKEALLKATGRGLRVDPRSVDTVRPAAGGTALQAYDVGPAQVGLPAGYVLAYAVEAAPDHQVVVLPSVFPASVAASGLTAAGKTAAGLAAAVQAKAGAPDATVRVSAPAGDPDSGAAPLP